MKERIEKIMSLYSLTSVKMAEIMDVQPSNISHIISGRNNPSYDFIAKLLSRFPELSPDWIISGTGDVYRSKSAINTDVNDDKSTFVNRSHDSYNVSTSESRLMFDISSNTDLPVTYLDNTNVTHKPLLDINSDVSNQSKILDHEYTPPVDSNDYSLKFNNGLSDVSTKADSGKPQFNTLSSHDTVSQSSKDIKSSSQKSTNSSSDPQNSPVNEFHSDCQSISQSANLIPNTDKSVKKIIFIYTDNTFEIFSN